MNIPCDHDGNLEVAQRLNLCKRLRVLVYPLLNIINTFRIKSPLSEAAGLAITLRVYGDGQFSPLREELLGSFI